MTRQVTEQILKDIEMGILDKDAVIMACLKYMREDEVADMAHINEFIPEEDHEEEPDVDYLTELYDAFGEDC